MARGVPRPALLVALSQDVGFLRSRWHGAVPLPRLFWLDMVGMGTVINLLATFVALMMAAQGAKSAVAVAVHFAPMPWNLFLAGCVLRHPQARTFHRAGALVWLALTVVI